MANVSRTRVSILTLQQYLKGLITTAQPTWDVQIFPHCDFEQIFKFFPALNVNTGACVITYAGAKWGTFEKPSPVRQMVFKIVVAYNLFAAPADAVTFIQTMIESVIATIDCQIYNNQATFLVQGDSMAQPIDKGSGVTTAIIDVALDDVSG